MSRDNMSSAVNPHRRGHWIFASLVALDVLVVAPEYMYWDYANPSMVAWNWSFLLINALFAVAGLYGRFGQTSELGRNILSTFSMSLMFCAGVMAISFWLVAGSFDPFWWSIDLWLVALASWVLTENYRTHQHSASN